MTSKTILFRVDADSEIGAGHLMRCLALAQAWKSRGASVVFAMARSAPLLKNRLVENGIEVVPLSVEPGTTGDAEKTVLSARNINAVWIVVDGYVFDAAFQRILKENNLRTRVRGAAQGEKGRKWRQQGGISGHTHARPL